MSRGTITGAAETVSQLERDVSAQATVAGSPQPTTHFRHGGVACVSFLDGHVETRTEVPVASPANWSAAANALRAQQRIGYLADVNLPYEGQ